jgi:hypothetical protein
MKYIVLALALSFALSPLEAAPKSTNTHAGKPKRGKVRAHKPPKNKHSGNRAN